MPTFAKGKYIFFILRNMRPNKHICCCYKSRHIYQPTALVSSVGNISHPRWQCIKNCDSSAKRVKISMTNNNSNLCGLLNNIKNALCICCMPYNNELFLHDRKHHLIYVQCHNFNIQHHGDLRHRH